MRRNTGPSPLTRQRSSVGGARWSRLANAPSSSSGRSAYAPWTAHGAADTALRALGEAYEVSESQLRGPVADGQCGVRLLAQTLPDLDLPVLRALLARVREETLRL